MKKSKYLSFEILPYMFIILLFIALIVWKLTGIDVVYILLGCAIIFFIASLLAIISKSGIMFYKDKFSLNYTLSLIWMLVIIFMLIAASFFETSRMVTSIIFCCGIAIFIIISFFVVKPHSTN